MVRRPVKCQWCLFNDRTPVREVTGGCVHEHVVTLLLCDRHEIAARGRAEVGALFCNACHLAGISHAERVLITPVSVRS
jgi:hypothetical protein